RRRHRDRRGVLGGGGGRRNQAPWVLWGVRMGERRPSGRPSPAPAPPLGNFVTGGRGKPAAGRHKPLDGRRLREMHKQALGGLLVLAEVPNAPEERQARREASFRP